MRLHMLALLTALAWPLVCAADWPGVSLPPGVRDFALGQDVSINGLPMRVRGFVSRQPAPQVVAWFRASLGMPLVENQLGGSVVLGRAQGRHYLTVQIEPAGTGSRGLIAQTDLPAMLARRDEERALSERWLVRLPPGVRLQSLTRGQDGSRHSQYLVLDSMHPASASSDAIRSVLQQDGYVLERRVPGAGPPSETLYFRGPGQEAVAVIVANPDGSSAIVVNTVVMTERAQ